MKKFQKIPLFIICLVVVALSIFVYFFIQSGLYSVLTWSSDKQKSVLQNAINNQDPTICDQLPTAIPDTEPRRNCHADYVAHFATSPLLLPVSQVLLGSGIVGQKYSTPLPISGVRLENIDTIVAPQNLPPGLSIILMALPCAPQVTQCPSQPTLIGTPTRSGSYKFTVTTPSEMVNFSLQIK